MCVYGFACSVSLDMTSEGCLKVNLQTHAPKSFHLCPCGDGQTRQASQKLSKGSKATEDLTLGSWRRCLKVSEDF